jgi:hypothetical protein
LGGVNVIGRGVVGVIDWTDPKLAGRAGVATLFVFLGQRRLCLFRQAIPTVPFKLS